VVVAVRVVLVAGVGQRSPFAGRTVYLSFFVGTNPTLLTTFYLDRVTLQRGEHP
jgi:sulfite exporter TauE/SafE